MSVIRPDFLKVLPDDIERVGVAGACVLALVHYATAVADEHNDRLPIDGLVWWRATYAEIGASLGGVSGESIRYTVGKLAGAGELDSCNPYVCEGDRTKAYRIPSDQPLRKIPRPPTSHYAKSPDPLVKSPDPLLKSPEGSGENPVSIPYRELGEVREREGGRARDPDSPPRCPRHINDPHPPNCWSCKELREEYEREHPPLVGADAKAAAWQALKATDGMSVGDRKVHGWLNLGKDKHDRQGGDAIDVDFSVTEHDD